MYTYIHILYIHICIYIYACIQGLFKMDTVGDAYIVAGWVQELDSKEVSVSEEAIKQKSEHSWQGHGAYNADKTHFAHSRSLLPL
jgi:hypothetical protein